MQKRTQREIKCYENFMLRGGKRAKERAMSVQINMLSEKLAIPLTRLNLLLCLITNSWRATEDGALSCCAISNAKTASSANRIFFCAETAFKMNK